MLTHTPCYEDAADTNNLFSLYHISKNCDPETGSLFTSFLNRYARLIQVENTTSCLGTFGHKKERKGLFFIDCHLFF
jgi:hypothetical protein